ncbi:MAG: AbrB/MazE/SpoVT family DNA-binding domain-containing protein [Terracidiphilus sp.]
MSARVALSANGRIVIPAAIREQMGFAPGDTLLMEVDDLAGPERMLSDELIAERRAEAWREQVEADRERAATLEQNGKAG